MNKVKKINSIFLWTVLIYILGSFLIGRLALDSKNLSVVLLLSQLFLIIPTIIYILKYRLNLRETIRFNKVSFSNVLLIIVFGYLIMPLMGVINLISQLFSTNMISNSVNVIVENNPLILSLFFIAFIPCIFEETVYRGVFYNEYRKVSLAKGVFLSALLFGLLHMNFNQFSYAFVMGAVFALLIEATDSILASMIVHFTINGTSVVFAYFIPKVNDLVTSLGGEQASLITEQEVTKQQLLTMIGSTSFVAIITTILAVLVYKAIAKNSGRYEIVKNIFKKPQIESEHEHMMIEEDTKLENMSLFSFPLLMGILICVVIMIMTEIQ